MRTGGTARVNGVLAVSRAIGNYLELKKYVIAEPEIMFRDVGDKDEFILIASDGLWDFLSDQESVDFARKLMGNTEYSLAQVSRFLVSLACERGSKDDVCVLVIDLRTSVGRLREEAASRATNNNYTTEEMSTELNLSDLTIGECDFSNQASACDPGPTPRHQRRRAW
jgi:serine/threonine protein phosphatase PrpC